MLHRTLGFSFKLAARNVTRQRTRTLISLSAISFGVVALLLAGGFVEWIFWATREAAIQTGLGHVQITRPGFRDAGLSDPALYLLPSDASDLKRVASAPGVTVVEERLMLSGLVSNGETTIAFAGEAVDPAGEPILSKVLDVKGQPLATTDPRGVLLGRGLAAALGVKLGDDVSFVVSLPGGGINAVEGHVSGTFATQVKAYDDSAVRMPIALGRELLRVRGAHVWVVGLDATEDTPRAVASLKALLPIERFEVSSWLDLSDFYRKTVELLSRQIDVVTLLIGVIIVLGISNTLTMNVLERTSEIGTLMAMGTTRRQILRLFVAEGVLLGIAGGLAGLVVGFLLASALSYFGIPMPPPPGRDTGYSAQIILTLRIAILGFAVAVVSTTLASLYPAWKAARLPIVDALRHSR